ncbi:hypothetical protein [Dyadobacter tibetensis]|uniref:hypothetical protein n=1 Tax=Dyadobacter tibetensis TaxID=1211851 RepID=UPI000472A1EC|nr:hypothetical protein [Dyadobacter tibetensis]
MKLQDLISSGLLEAYLLGMVDAQERQSVNEIIDNNPEAMEYLIALENRMQNYFLQGSVSPPEATREILTLRLQQARFERTPKGGTSHDKKASASPEYLDIEVEDTQMKVHKFWRPAFIAVFILSKIFLILGLYFYFKTASLEKELDAMRKQVKPTPTVNL